MCELKRSECTVLYCSSKATRVHKYMEPLGSVAIIPELKEKIGQGNGVTKRASAMWKGHKVLGA